MNRSAKQSTSQKTPENFTERLSFADTMEQLSALQEIIFNLPDTNAAKIQFIKEEIEAGRYQIEAAVIAGKMFEQNQQKELEPEPA